MGTSVTIHLELELAQALELELELAQLGFEWQQLKDKLKEAIDHAQDDGTGGIGSSKLG